MVCLNKKDPETKQILEDLTRIVGSESAAYYLLAMNNGNSLELTPDGKPSLLWSDIYSACGGNKINAVKEKAYYYTQQYIKANGDWTTLSKEPRFAGLHGLHNTNTSSLDVLCNDSFDEINSLLQSSGVDNKGYAMHCAIERSRLAYISSQEGKFHETSRQEQIDKYNSRGFWKKVLGFFWSKYNKKLLTDPQSKDKRNVREQSIKEFNATLNHSILQSLKDRLNRVTNNPLAQLISDFIDKHQLDGNEDVIKLFMNMLSFSKNNRIVNIDNDQYVNIVNVLSEFNTQLYQDGIALCHSKDLLIKLLCSDNNNSAYKNSFNARLQSEFLDQLKSIINSDTNIEECQLMWENRDFESAGLNTQLRDLMIKSLSSRLESIRKLNRSLSNKNTLKLLIEDYISKLKKVNVNNNNDVFNMYFDFLNQCVSEITRVNRLLENNINQGTLFNTTLLMYSQTDVIGFYSNIVNKYLNNLQGDKIGLTSSQVQQLNDSIKNIISPLLSMCISKYNTMLDMWCEDAIDKYVKEYHSLGDIESLKYALVAELKNKINNGSIGMGENWIGDATQSQSGVVRMIANMLNNDEREVQRKTSKVGHTLLSKYSKAEGFLSKLGIHPKNYAKLYVELDKNGMPTGYFVRGAYNKATGKTEGVNYGQFEQDKRAYEQKLRIDMHLLADDHGNTIWNFDIQGERDRYNTYMDKLDDWLDDHCNRRFKAEYYKMRRRMLTPEALELLDEIESQINKLVQKCTDENGNTFIHKLEPGEQLRYRSLQHLKETLSNMYTPVLDNNGTIISCERKTGLQYEIAKSITRWNKYVLLNVKRKNNWTKFNAARATLPQAEQDLFDYDNKRQVISEDFYRRLANCSTVTQTEYYLWLSSSKNKIGGTVKENPNSVTNNKGFGIMPNLMALSDTAWEKLREIETEMSRKKTIAQGRGSEKFEDIAEIRDVMHPTLGISMYSYFEQQALNNLSTDPDAYNKFLAKYHYTDRNGKAVPLSIFSYIVPKDPSYIEESLLNGYSELDEQRSPVVNKDYNSSDNEAYQPKFDMYKNDAYDKIVSNKESEDFYNQLMSTMDELISFLPDSTSARRYKMPLITAQSSDILSRNLARLNLRGAVQSVSQHFTVTELDTDVYREDLATLPNGQIVQNVPIRFVSSLEDPTKISCDIIKTVTLMYEMALNYKLKSVTVPKCEAFISLMRGGITTGTLEETDQTKRAQQEVEMYGYGKMTTGFGDKNKKMGKWDKRWTKFFNSLRNIGNVALLAGNLFSAAKGFISAYYQTGTEALVGKYYDKGDRFWTTGLMLKELPNALRSITQGNTHSKIQAAMQYNGLGTSLEDSFGGHDKTAIRKLLGHFKMGPFTLGDYTTNAIVMMSVYHATRLVKNRNGVYEFMTEEECIDDFIKQGKSEREAIKYFEEYADNHLYGMYHLADDGSFEMSDKVTVLMDGNKVEIDPHDYITKKVENRISATVERRASIINGVVAKHGKNRLYQGTLTKLLVTMRGYMFSQGYDRLKGGDDFSLKYYSDGSVREMKNSDVTYRGQYDMETGHCEIGVLRSLKYVFKSAFWKDLGYFMPILSHYVNHQRHMSRGDMLNILKFCLDVCGLASFLLICTAWLIPPVKKYPDDWWRQFLALVAMGCGIETATPVNPMTVLDVTKTVSTTWSYIDNVRSMGGSIADVFGLMFDDENEFDKSITSGAYKYKPKWFRALMKGVLKPTGITGYYETFAPSIEGLDSEKSPYLERKNQILSRIESEGLSLSDFNPWNTQGLISAYTSPVSVLSKYDWYHNQSGWPANMFPDRKDKKQKKENKIIEY